MLRWAWISPWVRDFGVGSGGACSSSTSPSESSDPLTFLLNSLPSSPFCRYNSLQHGKHSCTPEDGKRDAKVGAAMLVAASFSQLHLALDQNGPTESVFCLAP